MVCFREIAAGAALPPRHVVDRLAQKKKTVRAQRQRGLGKR